MDDLYSEEDLDFLTPDDLEDLEDLDNLAPDVLDYSVKVFTIAKATMVLDDEHRKSLIRILGHPTVTFQKKETFGRLGTENEVDLAFSKGLIERLALAGWNGSERDPQEEKQDDTKSSNG